MNLRSVFLLLAVFLYATSACKGQCVGNSELVQNNNWYGSLQPMSPPWSGNVPPSVQGSVLPPPCDAPGYGTNCTICPSTWNTSVGIDQYVLVYLCAGQRYEFSTCETSYAWDAQLTLVGPDGAVVGFDDDGCGTLNGHAVLHYVPIIPGQYILNVNNPDCAPEPTWNLVQLKFQCLPMYCPTAGNSPCGATGGNSCNPNIEACPGSLGSVQLGTATSLCVQYSATMNGSTPSGVALAGCGMENDQPDTWFTAIMPINGKLLVVVENNGSMDLAMALFTAPSCLGPFTHEQCSGDLVPGIELDPTLEIDRPDLAGEEVYIRVWQEGGTIADGAFTICIRDLHPVNDEPCGALALDINLSCLPIPQDMRGASLSVVPLAGCSSPTSDTWYTVHVPENGELRFDSDDLSVADAAIALYRPASGSCSTNDLVLELLPNGCATTGSTNIGAGNMPSLANTGLTPGEQLWLRLMDESGSNGEAAICAYRSDTLPIVMFDSCFYTLRMYDTGGNGWDGSYVEICSGSPSNCSSYTLFSGFGEVSFKVGPDDTIIGLYHPIGDHEDEISFFLEYAGAAVVASVTAPPGSGLVLANGNLCTYPPPNSSDCVGAIWLYDPVGPPLGGWLSNIGAHDDLFDTNRGCLVANEQYNYWFNLTMTNNRPIAFELTTATIAGQDLDFALWGPMDEFACPPIGDPIRCSYAQTTGGTGMNFIADDTSEDASGDGWVRYVDGIAGERYTLYIGSHDPISTFFQLDWMLSTDDQVDPIIDEKDVLIFPNPTSGSTTLRCTLPNACKYAVLVIDAAGRTISTVQWISSAGQQDIPVAAETMEAGAYIIELRDAKGLRVGRTRLMKLGR